jgi:ubiquinone/menaquinone biosynthesis C-methylase UbiE
VDYDKTEIAKTYQLARDHGPDFLRQWMDEVAAHLGPGRIHAILDLGCGTGRFSEGLAARFEANVVGIDPSSKMLLEARRNLKHSRVFYSCGSAEALPLPANSVDVIFISMVFHHFSDPERAALECHRVLRKDGRVLLRTGSREKIPVYPYVPYFPTSRTLLEQRLPSLAFQCQVFEAACFRILFSGNVTQQIASDYREYADKLALRADSILVSLDDEEFNEGVRSIRAKQPSGPIVEPIDFVVFGKRP